MAPIRFLRGLLSRREEDAAVTAGLADLPRLLDGEEAAIAARVGPAFEEPGREVRGAVADLSALLVRLEGADWDAALHPKLEQISRTTLPAFVRAMEACLARPLPDGPHEFYAAATAQLKCMVSALRGQGRYLRAVLPEEMKAVKKSVDVAGRAVNRMTDVLGEEKRALGAVRALRGQVDRIAALEGEERDASRRAGEAAARADTLARERDGVASAMAELDASPGAAALAEETVAAEKLRERARALEDAHRAQASGLARVIKRAERLVARKGDRQVATQLHHLQGLLDAPLGDGADAVPAQLRAGLVAVQALIDAGEIAPKEGDPIRDGPDAIVAAIEARIEEHARVTGEARALERGLAASPVALERERLGGRLRQLEHGAAALQDERAGLLRVAEQKAQERAGLLERLGETVEGVFGDRVCLDSGDA
ncbi:MAG: hypothetical protein GXY82_09290 [Methanospirillum sp.]|nr:hypothetical protein [Methanospirillum sp.]